MRTDECNIYTARCERASFGGPSQTILENPSIKSILCLLSEAKVWGSDTLKDIVVVLGCAEDTRRRVRNIPKVNIEMLECSSAGLGIQKHKPSDINI